MNKYFTAILLALTATTSFANQNAINIVKSTIKSTLKDPESAIFKDVKIVTNSKGEKSICGSYNAKNSYGGYVGYKGFSADVKTGTIKSLEGLDDYVLNGCSGRAAELNLLQEKKNQEKNTYIYYRSSEICKAYGEFLVKVYKNKKSANLAFEEIKQSIENNTEDYRYITTNNNSFAKKYYYKEYKPSVEEYAQILSQVSTYSAIDIRFNSGYKLENTLREVLANCKGNQYKLYEGNMGNFRQHTKEEELAKTNAIELWKADVVNLAMKNWEKPSSIDNEISTEIAVMVDNTGKLLNISWVERTNNKTVDRSIVNAFKKAKVFKAPPTPLPTFTVVVSFPPKAVKTSEQ